jgi:hypothetical protein
LIDTEGEMARSGPAPSRLRDNTSTIPSAPQVQLGIQHLERRHGEVDSGRRDRWAIQDAISKKAHGRDNRPPQRRSTPEPRVALS